MFRLSRLGLAATLAFFLAVVPARAVIVGSSYQTTEPTNSNITNWESGWGASGITGWDYVGYAGDASGVYLGNGWVLTADHVDITNLTYVLGGVTYQIIASSVVSLSGSTADLSLFQITSTTASLPNLPSLTISSTAPVVNQTKVVMIGYGNSGTKVESWGMNVVTGINQSVAIDQTSWVTTDFTTTLGKVGNYTNSAKLIDGDSGGAAFAYNSATGTWELMGILEAVAGNTSYIMQLSEYRSLILSTVPEPSVWSMIIASGLVIVTLGHARRNRALGVPTTDRNSGY
ncbi:MAG: trypsin-like peptidase domain-containing protein [Verrucomicrobia bacterium]|nr:trypsin-like peptidase domain-containing protein [Verrucomicrobiota bacterium]